jgi:hypothetical protein
MQDVGTLLDGKAGLRWPCQKVGSGVISASGWVNISYSVLVQSHGVTYWASPPIFGKNQALCLVSEIPSPPLLSSLCATLPASASKQPHTPNSGSPLPLPPSGGLQPLEEADGRDTVPTTQAHLQLNTPRTHLNV